jgi:hypothetical protein
MKFIELDVPTGLRPWQVNDVARKRVTLADESRHHVGPDGLPRWNSNNKLIPPWVFEEAFVEAPVGHLDAYNADSEAFFQQLRAEPPRPLSDEQRFEMRAAFGPGVTVVDILTGRKTET